LNRKLLLILGVVAFLAIIITPLLLGTLFKRQPKNLEGIPRQSAKPLVVWNLFDPEDAFTGAIQQYQTNHPNVRIEYLQFNNLKEYENLLLNQLAEGTGPDVVALQNSWFLKYRKKLSPLPTGLQQMSTDRFRQTFVGITADDLILKDESGKEQIYGVPLFVDTLALYYNSSHFRDYVPTATAPASTWLEITKQVQKLNHPDNSFERFLISGLAAGRADNLRNALPFLYLLFIQNKTQLFTENLQSVVLDTQQGLDPLTQESFYPALNALKFYTSFALPDYAHYAWNDLITRRTPQELELGVFAKGRLAMMTGFSSDYEKIKESINQKKQGGVSSMNVSDIKITSIPQLTREGRDAYAEYFPLAVSRNSTRKETAWDFVLFLSQRENAQNYFLKTHKPTARLDLVEEQSQDPIYGIFALQASFAKSLPVLDSSAYQKIFTEAINSIIEGRQTPQDALRIARGKLQCVLDQFNNIPGKLGTDCFNQAKLD